MEGFFNCQNTFYIDYEDNKFLSVYPDYVVHRDSILTLSYNEYIDMYYPFGVLYFSESATLPYYVIRPDLHRDCEEKRASWMKKFDDATLSIEYCPVKIVTTDKDCFIYVLRISDALAFKARKRDKQAYDNHIFEFFDEYE